MKKFFYLSAVALAFAACSTEEFEAPAGAQGGAKMELSIEGTRLSNEGWANGDRLGVAWIDLANEQIKANNIFKFSGNAFAYEGDIFMGQYFAYWPYQKFGQGGQTFGNITLPATQKEASAEKQYLNGAFAVSAQDLVNPFDKNGDVVDVVKKSFSLVTIANGINIKTAATTDNAGALVGAVTVTATSPVFVTTAAFTPSKLPAAVYTAGAYNAKATLAALNDKTTGVWGNALKAGAAATTLTTDAKDAKLPIAEAQSVSLLTFPTAAANVTATDVTIKVQIVNAKGKELGYYTIAYNDNADTQAELDNNDNVSKLAALLNGGYTQKGKTYSLQELNTNTFGIDVNLLMKNYTETGAFEVNKDNTWDAVVAKIDAAKIGNANIVINEAVATVDATVFPATADVTVYLNPAKTTKFNVSGTVNKAIDFVTTGTFPAVTRAILGKTVLFQVAKGASFIVNGKVGAFAEALFNVDGEMSVNNAFDPMIRVYKDTDKAGVLNLGAKGVIDSVENMNVVNVTPGATNQIKTFTQTDMQYDEVAHATVKTTFTAATKVAEMQNTINNVLANATAVVKNVEANFNSVTVDAPLALNDAKIAYNFAGTTTVKDAITAPTATLNVAGDMVLAAGSSVTATKVAVAKGATLEVAAKTDKENAASLNVKTLANEGEVANKGGEINAQETTGEGAVSGGQNGNYEYNHAGQNTTGE